MAERDRGVRDRGERASSARRRRLRPAADALIVATLNNGGNLLAVNAFYLQIIIGAVILAAVAYDQWQGRRA